MNKTDATRLRSYVLKISTMAAVLLAVIAIWPGTVLAQEENRPTSSDDDDRTISEIVVTGTRIGGRSVFETPSPVVQIGSELIENSSFISIDDVLIRSPVMTPGVGLSNQSIGQDSGAAFANLRGIGTGRTLTLIDGRRRVPGNGFNSAVDINSVSPSMIERVEIVTGGTSAIYGADSIAGVVNIILKRNLEGVELSAKWGSPSESPGGESQQYALTAGANIADKQGNLSLGVFYDTYTGFDDIDRSYARGNKLTTLRVNQANTGPDDGISDLILVRDPRISIIPETGAFVYNGIFRTVDENGLRPLQNDWAQLNPDGSIFDIYASGGDGLNFAKIRPLRTSLDRGSMFGRLWYEIAPNVELFSELDISIARGRTNDEVPVHGFFDRPLFVTRDNPLLDPDLTAFMDANGLGDLYIYRSAFDMGRFKTLTDRNTATFAGGLRGSIDRQGMFGGWQWEVYYQNGKNKVQTTFEDAIFRDRYYQAYDVIADPVTGEPVCRDSAARAAGCLPLRAIGPANDVSDPRFRSWLYTNTRNDLTTTQSIISASLTGDLWELQGGKVQTAIGVMHREETLEFEEDPALTEGRIYELDLFLTQSNRSGEQSIDELFGEARIPLLKNKAFVDELSIEGSGRISDYDTFGKTNTWKVGMLWGPIEDIRFRATRAKSVRAPTINELYSPGTPGSRQILDPCDVTQINLGSEYRAANCSALGIPDGFMDDLAPNTIIFTGGNVNLDPETAHSWTGGIVITPRFLERFQMSVDYYDITLDGAIGSTSVETIIRQCVDLPSINNVFCPQIHRNPVSFQLDSVDNTLINLGRVDIRGLDWQIAYKQPVSNLGDFSFSLGGTHMDRNNVTADATRPDQIIKRAGELLFPRLRMNANFSFDRGPLNVNWFINYIGPTVVDRQQTSPETYPRGYEGVESQTYHYLAANYDFGDRFTLHVNINNVFDTPPPAHPYITGAGNFGGGQGLYDNQGRVYYLGGKYRF